MRAYQYIKDRVISGAFSPGMRLTEEQLASELGTSRTPVREAMKTLVSDGALLFKPNYGTFVGSWTADEIAHAFDLRVILESEITLLATERIADHDIRNLIAIQDELESRGCDFSDRNLDRISLLNRKFHQVIAEASEQKRMIAMLSNAIEMPISQQTFRRYTESQLRRSFAHHRELIEAFIVRDKAWAKDIMRCHIRAAKHARLDGEPKKLPDLKTVKGEGDS
ncbi:MAG: GntR family transcriptional regulator [Pseudomonadota bacterium]